MTILIVVENPREWALRIPNVHVVAARDYLNSEEFTTLRTAKVFNLCRSYRYQSLGYYVSLLAEARGHKPQPDMTTLLDLRSQSIVRDISEDLDQLIQKSLASLQSKEFVLSIYFGKNLAKQHQRLSLNLYNLFPVPLLRARFVHHRKWQLQTIGPIAADDIPDSHHDFVIEAATQHFTRSPSRVRRRALAQYDMAILHDPNEEMPPSDERALKRFAKAAERAGFDVEFITRDDYGRLAEFDALFIRATTAVNHHTYRFARRAAAEGLAVIDDPESILRCTNKVYLYEALRRHHIPTPRSHVVSRGNLKRTVQELGLPAVIKQPDSAFSQGVVLAESPQAFMTQARNMLTRSELIIAQEYMPTPYDWRVGIYDNRALYVCRYYMAGKHWQIVQRDAHGGRPREGRAETISVDEAPKRVVNTALRAARLIGDGLYGVDLKVVGRSCYVIEVNDNPSIDAGVEDAVLGNALYDEIMRGLKRRVEELKGAFTIKLP